MNIKPLSKAIHTKAKELGVESIVLSFSGGSDEGYLDVGMGPDFDYDFAEQINAWAMEAYDYSGAGDGNAYGDNITYDIKNGKATCEEWYTITQTGETSEFDIEVDEEDEE